ncbi:MAG: hypothetical protein HY646_07370 [Acidobacteria bacterium]|nr:hypothetical protein [Acidobacteriota bacterium]
MALRLPRLWVGYTMAVLLLVAATPATPGSSLEALSGLLALSAWLYWLYCVYKFHDVMDRIPGYNHPITPSRAVAMHFVPFYNFYWTFKWPREIATFINWRTQTKSMDGRIVGVVVLLAFIINGAINPFLGLVLLFTAGVYISHSITKALSAPPVPASAMARPGVGPLGL